MFRKKWLNCVGVISVALLASQVSADPPPRPNVVLIMADDFGWGDLNANIGSRPFDRKISTPNLDMLAANGMRFDNFYSNGTVCTPTRASLLTSLDSGRSLARGNAQAVLRPESTTIGEVLQGANYSTHAYGKWGVGGAAVSTVQFVDPPPVIENGFAMPTAQGFDSYVGIVDTRHAWNYWSSYTWQGDQNNPIAPVTIPGNVGVNPATGPTAAQAASAVNVEDLFTDSAVNMINGRQPGDDPFFAYVPFITPHRTIASLPIDPIYANAGSPGDALNPNGGAWPTIEKQFASALTAFDQRVGAIVQALQDSGQLDNTLILLTGDNGPQQTEGHQAEFFDSNGGLQGIKRDLTEGGIRAPLIASWNGTIAPGTVNHMIGTHADFMPTFAELAGVSAPDDIDGISFAAALTGGPAPIRNDPIYFEFWEQGFSQAARADNFKIVRRTSGVTELYDLAVDPGESNNLANDPSYASQRATLEQYLSDRRNYTIQYDARYTQDSYDTIEDTGGVASVRDYELRLAGDAERVGPQAGDSDVSAYVGIDHALQFSGNGTAHSKGASVGGELAGLTVQDVAFSLQPSSGGNMTTHDASFELWFKPSDLIGKEILFELGGTTDGLSVLLDADTALMRVKDGGIVGTIAETVANTTGMPELGVLGLADFNQIVAVIDIDATGAHQSLYLNGVLLDTIYTAGVFDWAGGDGDALAGIRNTLGGDNGDLGAFGGFEGLIAQFKIYEFALTEQQVLSRFTKLAVVPEPAAFAVLSFLGIGILARRKRRDIRTCR
jgi:arylsulfatase A-like enzyme